MSMKLLPVYIGLPVKVDFQGKNAKTVIIRELINYYVKLRKLNFGDKRTDLRDCGSEELSRVMIHCMKSKKREVIVVGKPEKPEIPS